MVTPTVDIIYRESTDFVIKQSGYESYTAGVKDKINGVEYGASISATHYNLDDSGERRHDKATLKIPTAEKESPGIVTFEFENSDPRVVTLSSISGNKGVVIDLKNRMVIDGNVGAEFVASYVQSATARDEIMNILEIRNVCIDGVEKERENDPRLQETVQVIEINGRGFAKTDAAKEADKIVGKLKEICGQTLTPDNGTAQAQAAVAGSKLPGQAAQR